MFHHEVFLEPWLDELARLKKEREKEDQTNPFMEGLKTVGSSVKGVGTGARSAIKGTGVGLWNTFRHPVETGESLYTAVRHPIVTSKAIGKSVKDSYDENMAKGNAESRADWVT